MTDDLRSCLETFEAAPEDSHFVDYINTNAPNCRCESSQVSRHCNEPVLSHETLIRLIVDDTHVKDEGGELRLKSTFLSDVNSVGASTLRLGRATRREFSATIDELIGPNRFRADGSPRTVVGYVKVPVTLIRELEIGVVADGAITVLPHYGAYATALPDRPNHADMAMNATQHMTNSRRVRRLKNLGEQLQAFFRRVNSLEEVLSLASDDEASLGSGA